MDSLVKGQLRQKRKWAQPVNYGGTDHMFIRSLPHRDIQRDLRNTNQETLAI